MQLLSTYLFNCWWFYSGGTIGAKYNVGDIVFFQEADGQQYEVTAINNDALTIRQLDNPNGGGLKSALADGTDVRRRWDFYDLFDSAFGTSPYATGKNLSDDEMHIVVFDRTGLINGFRKDTVGERTSSVLETFAFVSKAFGAKTPQGGTNYYPDVIFKQSSFVYWLDHSSVLGAGGGKIAAGTAGTSGDSFPVGTGTTGEIPFSLSGGTDDYAVSVGELDSAYEEFADAETVDVNLIMEHHQLVQMEQLMQPILLTSQRKEKTLLSLSHLEEKMWLISQTLPHKHQMSRVSLIILQVLHTQF